MKFKLIIKWKVKRSCKLYGKFLAYVLASRSIFRFQSVSLIGHNLGCNIIKHCLSYLFEISKDLPDVFDIIQNVFLLSGTVSFHENPKWRKIFDLVGGKVINCYSENDELVKMTENYVNKSNLIGTKPLQFYGGICNKVKNYDLSLIIKNHRDYKENLDKIFDKIGLI